MKMSWTRVLPKEEKGDEEEEEEERAGMGLTE